MTTHQPNGALGLPCDEGDLLAWIEGETLGTGRSGTVTRALDRDPALAARAAAMRGDRQALGSLGEVRAPAGLVEAVTRAVEGTLERRMLLGLEREAPVEAMPRAAQVRVRRPSPAWSLLTNRSTWRLAAAAVFLVVVSGGAYWAATSWPSGGLTNGTVARGPEAPAPIALKGAEGVTESAVAVVGDTREIPPPIDPRPDPKTDASVTTLANADEPSPEQPAELTEPAPAPAMALATAVELAREGRLIVVIETAVPQQAAERIDAIAARGISGGSPTWRVLPEVPSAMMAMITGTPPVPTASPAGASHEEAPAAAAAKSRPIMVPFRAIRLAAPPAPLPIVAEVDRMYLAETRLDEAALASMLATLTAGQGWEARFEAAPEPVADEADVLTPAAVLWWAQPPGGWVDWSSVPVVVRRTEAAK